MCTCSYEYNQIPFVIYRVDEEKIATDMALPMIIPIASQIVILKLCRQRAIVVHDHAYDLLQGNHVISAGLGKPFPIFPKLLGMT